MNFLGTRIKKYFRWGIFSFLLIEGQTKYIHVNNGQYLSLSEKTQHVVARMWREVNYLLLMIV
jgi:hypothetical protein